MNAFDIMAEAKIRQWEQEKKEGKIKPAPDRLPVSLRSGDSLEMQLFADIKRLIIRACKEDSEMREVSLREAEKLQVQLSARLERRGCYHLTAYVSDELRKLKTRA